MAEKDTRAPAPAETPPRQTRGCAGIFLAGMLVIAAAWGAGLGLFLHLMDGAEKTLARADLHSFRPKEGSKVWSDDNPPRLLHEFSIESRQVVPLNEIPLNLQKAFLAGEDHRFYNHKGVRPDAILNAALFIVRTGKVRGGSTITQQLVRNIERTGVSTETTLQRKMKEALIALQLEREFTKDEILELYLNQIFLGGNAYGVEAASQYYFAKSCRDLTLAECALLAGLTPSPSRYSPFVNPQRALERRNTVLKQMLDEQNGFISKEEYEAAVAAPLEDSVVTPEEREQLKASVRREWPSQTAGYFIEEVRREVSRTSSVIEQQPGEVESVFESGLQIYTTLDTRLQEAAERILLKHMEAFDERVKKRDKSFMPVSGALVCIDNRPGRQGFVRAMVGGRDFRTQKFNMATQAKRQPGSSVKPVVWAAAVDPDVLGMSPLDVIVDAPYVKYFGNTKWEPKNFGGKYAGPVTLSRALQNSINTVSIRLTEKIGVDRLRQYMERVGMTTPIDPMAGLTLALGSSSVTVLDLATVYSVFANGGVRYKPILIREIRDRDGLLLEQAQPQGERVMDARVAYVVTRMMERVARFGTGAESRALDRPRAGKTGTTNDSKDAWFCGFTPDFTCVVWLGYEDNSPLGGGRSYTGGRLAVPIWTDFMIEAHKAIRKPHDFTVPDGIEFVDNGNFPDAVIAGRGRRSAPREDAPEQAELFPAPADISPAADANSLDEVPLPEL
jgi:penicillin-binding protein 1A